MGRCKKCGAKKVRRQLRTYSIDPEQDNLYADKTATVYFHRLFNLSINNRVAQYSAGQQALLDYPTIYLVSRLTPSNPPIGFVYPDQELEFRKSYGLS